MTKRRHDHFGERVTPSLAHQLRGSSLFDGGTDSDTPSVPVASSERGAERAAKNAPSQTGRILLALRAAGCIPGSGKYLSRDDLIERAKLTVNAACGRLGPSGKLVIPSAHYRPGCGMSVVAVEDVALSSDGNAVLGYQLTAIGVIRAARIIQARAAA